MEDFFIHSSLTLQATRYIHQQHTVHNTSVVPPIVIASLTYDMYYCSMHKHVVGITNHVHRNCCRLPSPHKGCQPKFQHRRLRRTHSPFRRVNANVRTKIQLMLFIRSRLQILWMLCQILCHQLHHCSQI